MLRGAEGITDMKIGNTGDGYDGTNGSLVYFYFVQTVKLIELADLDTALLVRLVMVYEDTVLVYFDSTVVHFADADTAHILVVVDGADQNLGSGSLVAFGSGDIVQNGLKQRHHVVGLFVEVQGGKTALCGSVDEGAVELLIGSVEIHQKLQNLVHNLIRTGFRTVNLVDTDDNRQIQLQSLAQYETGLGHRSLESIHHKDNAVYHLQDTLYLAAEICMARGVDDVDFCVFIKYSRVFGKDRDSTLSFNGIGVHDTFSDFLICAENAALFQKLVYKGRFTVVYMGDDRNVTHIFSFHKKSFLSKNVQVHTLLYVYQFTTNPVYHIFSRLQESFEIFQKTVLK